MSLPTSSPYVVIGAGIHGLSTAYHLARELESRGQGSGADILVLDKDRAGAGASGIACGVVRNNYYQPAMSELMAANVEVWEAHAETLHYNSVGYIALGAASQVSDLEATYERQQGIGYRSELILGQAEIDRHMRTMFPDWRGRGVEVCLHEHQGGFAYNQDAVDGLVQLCQRAGVTIATPVEVTGFELGDDDTVRAVETDRGRIAVDQVVIAPGPWAKHFWALLGMPDRIDITGPNGEVLRDQPMWTYWNLQEGEIQVDPSVFALPDGSMPPVIHIDSDAPLHDDAGKLITDELWGIYFKQDKHGIQGGASPLTVGPDAPIDPYPSTSDVDPSFPDMWCAALSHTLQRFEGLRPQYKMARSGGIGAFTADNFPVFDYIKANAYGILDSNHGYKMIGVGREVAKVLVGEHSSLLYPFRYERFATGDLHPVSNSPYPWS